MRLNFLDDVIARIHIWQHEGESVEHRELLNLSLSADNFEHAAVIVTVDLLHPWKLAGAVQKLLDVVEHHIDALKLPLGKLEECQKRQVRRWNEYADPGPSGSVSRKALSADDPSTYNLPEGVLTKNLGIPILVVVCKSDSAEQLEKDFGYKDGHFDYIQQHLRRICIRCTLPLSPSAIHADRQRGHFFHEDFKVALPLSNASLTNFYP